MVGLAKELQNLTSAENRITPKRRITRPNHTDEHIISEADLAKLENCGDDRLFSWSIFCFGGALSIVPQILSIVSKWWNSTSTSPVDFGFVDIVNIIIFFVCLIVGLGFYSAAPKLDKSLKKITSDIRERPSVDFE